jgi:pyruvate dehydrogenase E2 component (dihydrolipoamide acetyltransferase)
VIDFRMPSLGADMEKGTVVEWLKKPGERVARGDVVAVVETQKGAFEIEIFDEGVLQEILVPVGTEAPVGAVLARIEGHAATATPASAPTPPAMPGPGEAPSPPIMPPRLPPSGKRLRISPAAARRALELEVDARGLRGSGPQGAITVADVEAAAAKPSAAAKPPAVAAVPPKRGFDPVAMRQAIAVAMARSKREIPHYYLSLPIDMGRALEWIATENARRDVEHRLLAAVLLLKATALALRQVPQLNGFWVAGAPKLSPAINVGWAISLRGGGLMAPAVRDADKLSLDEAMAALRDLVTRARTARIRGSEMMDPTVTVTSLGEHGAESVLGVIYPPQLAIVGFGAVRRSPAVVEGQLAVRPIVHASLSGDHRATDGETGGRLLSVIDRLLQTPEAL